MAGDAGVTASQAEGAAARVGEFLSQDDLAAVRELLKLVTDHDLGELSVTREDGATISVTAHTASQSAAPVVIVSAPAAASSQTIPFLPVAPVAEPSSPAESPPSPTASSNRVAVASPMVGIYYGSPAPGEPPFVVPGDRIQVGQTIGLIEAMKVFSEIPSEIAGRVVEVAVANNDLVQLGQALLYVEPS